MQVPTAIGAPLAPPAALAKPPVSAAGTELAFEHWEPTGTPSQLARPVTLAALLLLSLLIVARAVVLQTRRQRMSPRMVLILLVLALLALYLGATAFDMPASVPALAVKGSP